MVFSKSELEYRDFVKNTVSAVCDRHNMVVYGSFFSGNFHLPEGKGYSYSDIDLIGRYDRPDIVINEIAREINDKTGILFKVSIRSNKNHISALPKNISSDLALIDTSIILCHKKQISEEFYSYLITKYLLRTLYSNVYFSENLVCIVQTPVTEKINLVLREISICKLTGKILSSEILSEVVDICFSKHKSVLDGLALLSSMFSINDVRPSWESFLNETQEFHLFELRNDIHNKMAKLVKGPNKCFNTDSQTRRSLSLAMGLSAG